MNRWCWRMNVNKFFCKLIEESSEKTSCLNDIAMGFTKDLYVERYTR